MLKNRRGISLTTMVITVMIMLVIMGTLVYSAVDSVKIRKLNKFYNDLRQLNDAIEIYYLKNGELPVDTTEYTAGTDEGVNFVLRSTSQAVSKENLFNPNDYDTVSGKATYKVVKLSLLENLSLNYPSDTYIVNTESHTVYNYTGITTDGKTYHALPINYTDVNYKENHPVKSISLKEAPGITNGPAGNNTAIYYAYSSREIRLKDLLVFGTNERADGSPTPANGLGEPKTVTFAISDSTYYTVGSETGILTRKEGITESTLPSGIVTLSVYTTDYQGNTCNRNFDIYISSVALKDKTDETTDVTKINLAVGQKKEFVIKRYGFIWNQSVGFDVIPDKENLFTSTYSYVSDNHDKIAFEGKNFGTTDVTIQAKNYGYAQDTVKVNVFDFDVYKTPNTSITEVTFGGVGANEAMDLLLNVKGPDGFAFSNGTTNTGNTVTWSIVKEEPANSGTYVADTTSGIVSLTTYESEHNYTKVTVTPLKTGTTYLKYSVKVENEVIKEGVVPIKVVGSISATGLTSTDEISLSGNTKTATLTYSLNSSLVPSGAVTYTSTSASSEFEVTGGTNGVYTVTYKGTSETTAKITLTATIGSNTYSDTVTFKYK